MNPSRVRYPSPTRATLALRKKPMRWYHQGEIGERLKNTMYGAEVLQLYYRAKVDEMRVEWRRTV